MLWSAIFLVSIILIMLIVATAYGITGSTWFPFQSPELRDIYEHLTPSEKRELTRLVRELNFQQVSPYGIAVGWMAVLFAFSYSVILGLILSAPFIIFVLTFGRREMHAYHRRVREMLCATEHARSRGYQPETLRMLAFPWNK